MAPESRFWNERFERFVCIQIMRGKFLAFARKLSPAVDTYRKWLAVINSELRY